MMSLPSMSTYKTHILASTLPNNPSTPLPHNNSKPPLRKPNIKTVFPPQANFEQQQKQQHQPSIAEIERAIGAGIFRDRDTHREALVSRGQTLFDAIFANSIGRTEGSMEKQLRETGEWIIDRAEGTPRSSGKKILMVVFMWILPMWILSFLVAAGIIKLPFNTPFLDDLIM